MCSGTVGQALRAVRAACFKHGCDGVGRQTAGLPVVEAVEQRSGHGQGGRVGVELVEVDLQVLDRLGSQGNDAGLVALAGEGHMLGLGQAEALQGQVGDLTDACGAVVEQDQQHPVPARFRGSTIEGGKDGPCLGFG